MRSSASNSNKTVGVLALQGAFASHEAVFESLGVRSLQVRTPEDLGQVDALVLPGGESTTISQLLESSELFEPVKKSVHEGMPVFGTCAGMILLSKKILDGRADQLSFGAIDIEVQRNAYGRQIDSFEADIEVKTFSTPFHAVFIRAPRISKLGSGVTVLAELDKDVVLARQNNVMVASFHPELSRDDRVHQLFLKEI
ncbi:MAG: pyridoxal 5'-phosphate synthase glutaminase subunit PdxT [Actinobacteria bacterium]|nr:pyridoxal 5'-phosphate synthase glutaminase subunit PdxT [Actinomycetota bacterium]